MPHTIRTSLGRLRCRYYAGNIELACRRGRYLNGQVQHIAFPDGRLVAEYDASGASVTGYGSEYFRTDHLGNTRLTFSDFNQDGLISWKLPANGPAAQESEITSENHYYPFGLSQKGPWYASVAPENKYLFNGIERNTDWGLNLDMADFRAYDPTVGRWWQVDELAEAMPELSAFRFGFNNPILYSDPYGLFESRDAARDYAKSEGIKTGLLRQNKIVKQTDGSWAIENKKDHSITFKDTETQDVIKAALVSAPSGTLGQLFEPERRDFTGFEGRLTYFLNSGNFDGYSFNRDGYATGFSPVAGMPPGVGPGGAFKTGAEFSKIIKGLASTPVKQGVKYVDLSGNRVTAIYKSLRTNGWNLQPGAASGGVKTLINPKTGEKIMFRQSKSGGYNGYDTVFQPVKSGQNAILFFK